ncbi:MAG: radical SAM protein [Candidatus Hecatellaceae archaeon]
MKLKPPDMLIWILTGRCNLSCSHCYASRFRGLKELSTPEALRVLREAWELGVDYVSFTGGEPLLRPDIFELLGEAFNLGMAMSLVSNGLTLQRETVQKLARLEVHVFLSVDGARETHELLRGPETWRKTVEAGGNLKAEGVSFSTVTVLAKETLKALNGGVEFARRFDAESACIIPVIPSGKASALSLPSPEEAAHALQGFVEEACRVGVPAEIWCAPFARLYVKPSQAAVYRCRTSRIVDLDVEGKMLLCDVLDFRLADVLEAGFKKAWETYLEHPIRRSLEKPVTEEPCRSCPLQSWCMGGCYARAFLESGSLYKPDPLCLRMVRAEKLQPTTL